MDKYTSVFQPIYICGFKSWVFFFLNVQFSWVEMSLQLSYLQT